MNSNTTRPTNEQLEKEIQRRWLRRETFKAVWGAIRTLLIFAAAAVLLTTLLFPVLRVQKNSMNPTLKDGEVVVFITPGQIRRGDIIAFHNNNQMLIKRVIAIPGDRIELADDGTVILNGMRLEESYITLPSRGDCTIKLPLEVPENQYFVMGDNRETSLDSRRADIGTIDKSQISGKAIFRIWPLNKLGIP